MTVETAYERCRTITRAAARNFYYGFVLLPNPRRAGIYAAYAFARRADDAVDEEGPLDAKLEAVTELRRELDAAYAGAVSEDDEVLVALADTVHRFAIPRQHFDALIDGVAMDLTTTRYASFAELKPYCDRVAGAVGLVSLHIFGFRNPEAPDHAADLGVGMQIVNIMRDVAEDAERDRIYLPQDEMAAHGVTDADILAGVTTPQIGRCCTRRVIGPGSTSPVARRCCRCSTGARGRVCPCWAACTVRSSTRSKCASTTS